MPLELIVVFLVPSLHSPSLVPIGVGRRPVFRIPSSVPHPDSVFASMATSILGFFFPFCVIPFPGLHSFRTRTPLLRRVFPSHRRPPCLPAQVRRFIGPSSPLLWVHPTPHMALLWLSRSGYTSATSPGNARHRALYYSWTEDHMRSPPVTQKGIRNHPDHNHPTSFRSPPASTLRWGVAHWSGHHWFAFASGWSPILGNSAPCLTAEHFPFSSYGRGVVWRDLNPGYSSMLLISVSLPPALRGARR